MTGSMFLVLMHTKAGAHKVYVQGHADGHIMDWNGCNFKFFSVPGQPFRGFKTKAEAQALLDEIKAHPQRYRQILGAARVSGGSWIADDLCCGKGCLGGDL